MSERVSPRVATHTGEFEDLLDRLAELEAGVSQLTLDRAELRTQAVLLKKRLDLLERRLNAPRMPL